MKVGVIGYGGAFNAGKQHMTRMTLQETFEASAICDLDPERERIAKEEFPGITYFTDMDEMLAETDAELIAIVLPHNLHASAALKCLKAGKHVVVEKPLAVTVEECDELIAESKKQGKIVVPYHNRHWDSLPLTMVKHLDKIGRPVRWESFWGGRRKPGEWWRSRKDVSGGIAYDWGAHIMEWMLQVMPYDMTEISGYGINEVWPSTNEDELVMTIRFGTEGVGRHITTDLDPTSYGPMCRVIGTEGALVAESHNRIILQKEDEDGILQQTILPLEPEAQSEFYKNVHDHLVHGEELVITTELGRRVIQILDYSSQSAISGQAMKAKYA